MPKFGRIRQFFINTILFSKFLNIETPGYVTGKFYTLSGKPFFIRNIFFPESFFVNLEKSILHKKGINGRKLLYSLGKQFGYRFCQLNLFPKGNINKVIISLIFQFFETQYAKRITLSNLDINNKLLELDTEELAITSKNHMGYIVTVGGCAGIWCYLFGDYSLECAIKKISEKRYKLISGPPKILKRKGLNVLKSHKKPKEINVFKYHTYNKPQNNLIISKNSVTELIKNGFIYYNGANMIIKNPNDRIIPVEISLLYEIEKTFDSQIIFNDSYNSFYNIGFSTKKLEDPYSFISELLTSFGFGIGQVISYGRKITISFNGYPWFLENQKESKFPFLKGAILGFLEGNSGNKYKIELTLSEIRNDTFSILLNVTTVNQE